MCVCVWHEQVHTMYTNNYKYCFFYYFTSQNKHQIHHTLHTTHHTLHTAHCTCTYIHIMYLTQTNMYACIHTTSRPVLEYHSWLHCSPCLPYQGFSSDEEFEPKNKQTKIKFPTNKKKTLSLNSFSLSLICSPVGKDR